MSLVNSIKSTYLIDHSQHAAGFLERAGKDDLTRELKSLHSSKILPVLERLTTGRAIDVFESLSTKQKRGVLRRASPRLSVLLIANYNDKKRDSLLSGLEPVARDDVLRVLEFPEDTAGRLMEKPVDVNQGMSINEVKARIRSSEVNRARYVYVVDMDNKLIGRVDMQDLALAEPSDELESYLHRTQVAVPATAHREEIVEFLTETRLDSVPVVDTEGRLMGVVRYQKIFEAIENVASADLLRMVGGSADERSLSSPGFSIKLRLPWLHINLLTAFMAAAVVGLFEDLIAQFTALAVLLPVVAGQSGNAGSQALAITIRGIALREIGIRDWPVVLRKEVIIGLVNGFVLAITCGLGVFLWSQSLGLALVIAVAMVLSMISAGIAGALVPLVLTWVVQDPATASSIILTTVTDVAGLFAFLGTATLLSFML